MMVMVEDMWRSRYSASLVVDWPSVGKLRVLLPSRQSFEQFVLLKAFFYASFFCC